MFKRFFLLLTVMVMTSCGMSVVYYQIATISSPQMSVSDDGRFCYNENDLTIDYDFWSDHGKVGFIITNNTDEDIFIDLSRSFLIVNGMTFDYYRNLTYKSGTSGIVNNSSSEKAITADNWKSMTNELAKDTTSPYLCNYNLETTEKEVYGFLHMLPVISVSSPCSKTLIESAGYLSTHQEKKMQASISRRRTHLMHLRTAL